MKCPYPDCQKDYNDKVEHERIEIIPYSNAATKQDDFLKTYSRKCTFCERYFHDVYSCKITESTNGLGSRTFSSEDHKLLLKWPYLNAKFNADDIDEVIKESFQEAEMCRSVGSIIGAGACLRKTVYALCDIHKVEGKNYKEKIENFPIDGKTYKDLMKQIKWLGDASVHETDPDNFNYTEEEIDIALSILPAIIDRIYEKDKKEKEALKILENVNSKRFKKKEEVTAE